jgi:DnaK suppressor protein
MMELHELKALLEHARRERASSVGNRSDIVIEQTADALDQTQSATQRDLAVSLLNREATTHRQVERALRRMEQGTYGLCLGCEKPIRVKRLEAVPWAEFCVPCQERRDAERHLGLIQEETDEYDSVSPETR